MKLSVNITVFKCIMKVNNFLYRHYSYFHYNCGAKIIKYETFLVSTCSRNGQPLWW